MTIDDLLGKSITELEAMSEQELYSHVQHMLPQTRPELASKPEQMEFKNASSYAAKRSSKVNQANDILKKFGLSIKI